MGENVEDDILSEMMALADINGDGKVDFEEFVRAAMS
jgi:Ca2+-binding EF-hand superfamily protein